MSAASTVSGGDEPYRLVLEVDGTPVGVVRSIGGVVPRSREDVAGLVADRSRLFRRDRRRWSAEATVERAAPMDAAADPVWAWFTEIRERGAAAIAGTKRQVVVVAADAGAGPFRLALESAWPSKIEALPIGEGAPGDRIGEAVREVVTLQYDALVPLETAR